MLPNLTRCLKGLGPGLLLAALALVPAASADLLNVASPPVCNVQAQVDPCGDPGRACDELRAVSCQLPVIVCVASSVAALGGCGSGSGGGSGGGEPCEADCPDLPVCELPPGDGGFIGDLQRFAAAVGAQVCLLRDAATGAVTAIVIAVVAVVGPQAADTLTFVGETADNALGPVDAVVAAVLAVAGPQVADTLAFVGETADNADGAAGPVLAAVSAALAAALAAAGAVVTAAGEVCDSVHQFLDENDC